MGRIAELGLGYQAVLTHVASGVLVVELKEANDGLGKAGAEVRLGSLSTTDGRRYQWGRGGAIDQLCVQGTKGWCWF